MPRVFGPSQANRITSHDANGALLLQQVADRYDIPVPAILAYVCTLGKCPHIVVLLLTLTVSLVRTGMPTSRSCQPCYRPAFCSGLVPIRYHGKRLPLLLRLLWIKALWLLHTVRYPDKVSPFFAQGLGTLAPILGGQFAKIFAKVPGKI